MSTIQYLTRSAWLSVHKLFTSCIRPGLVSRDSIVDGDWLPVIKSCQRYLLCCQPMSDEAENLEISFMECTGQRNDFELIPTVEMETRNTVVNKTKRRHFISVRNQPTRSTQPFILSRSIN